MFIEARLVIAQMSIHRQMDKWNVVDPCNGILFSHEKEWSIDMCYNMDFENIIISERSQTQKTTHYKIIFIWSIQGKLFETDSSVVVARGCGEGKMGSCSLVIVFQFKKKMF